MIQVKQFDLFSEEFILIKKWWKERSGVILPSQLVSDYGFMCYIGEKPIMGVFVYPVFGSSLALIGFPVASPESTKVQRKEAISNAVAKAEDFCKTLGYEIVVSYPGNVASQEMFSSLGYQKADENVVQFIKKLGSE